MLGLLRVSDGEVVDLIPVSPAGSGAAGDAERAGAVARWSVHVRDVMRQDDALANSLVASAGGGLRPGFDWGKYAPAIGVGLAGFFVLLLVRGR